MPGEQDLNLRPPVPLMGSLSVRSESGREFEPPASCSQSRRATGLRYTPRTSAKTSESTTPFGQLLYLAELSPLTTHGESREERDLNPRPIDW